MYFKFNLVQIWKFTLLSRVEIIKLCLELISNPEIDNSDQLKSVRQLLLKLVANNRESLRN